MRVGVPKEIKNNEFRVGLVPASVRELIGHGHEVFVQTSAGMGIGVSDDEYVAVGAQILPDAKIVFDSSKPSMIPIRLIDTTKAETLLGFKAKTGLEEGIKKTIDWYRETHG